MQLAQKVLIVGPNLTMQYIHSVSDFVPGAVNRVESTHLVAAGKGVNVLRALSHLKIPAELLLFSGGSAHSLMHDLMASEGLNSLIVPMKSQLRVTNTILCGDQVTEVIGQSPTISLEEEADYLKVLESLLETNQFSAVIFTGTSPETNETVSIYEKILQKMRRLTCPVIVDSSRPFLKSTQPESNWLLKINRDEFSQIFQINQSSDSHQEQCLEDSSWSRLLITDGSKAAFMKWDGKIYRATPEKIEKIVNPIGAGDVCCAAFTQALIQGKSPLECLEWSLFVASLSCKSMVPGGFDLESERKLV